MQIEEGDDFEETMIALKRKQSNHRKKIAKNNRNRQEETKSDMGFKPINH